MPCLKRIYCGTSDEAVIYYHRVYYGSKSKIDYSNKLL